MKKTLSITVYNEAGVLTRISTVFSSRNFNIDTITISATEKPGIARIIIVLPGNQQIVEQVIKQLNKLIQVIDVIDITNRPCVERELMLIKVKCLPVNRANILELVQVFRSKIVDISNDTLTLEITGDPGKMIIFEHLLEPYGILESVRTGKIAVERHLGINTEYLKNL